MAADLQFRVQELLLHGNVTVGLAIVMTDEVSHAGLARGTGAGSGRLEIRCATDSSRSRGSELCLGDALLGWLLTADADDSLVICVFRTLRHVCF